MLDLLIRSLSEIKSYVVVLSFFIKIMKQRIFQACSLKHSTKKGMFYVQSKLNFFKSSRGGVLPPSPLPPGYAPGPRVTISFSLFLRLILFVLHYSFKKTNNKERVNDNKNYHNKDFKQEAKQNLEKLKI